MSFYLNRSPIKSSPLFTTESSMTVSSTTFTFLFFILFLTFLLFLPIRLSEYSLWRCLSAFYLAQNLRLFCLSQRPLQNQVLYPPVTFFYIGFSTRSSYPLLWQSNFADVGSSNSYVCWIQHMSADLGRINLAPKTLQENSE